jgi:hypothetical protein
MRRSSPDDSVALVRARLRFVRPSHGSRMAAVNGIPVGREQCDHHTIPGGGSLAIVWTANEEKRPVRTRAALSSTLTTLTIRLS